MAIGFGLIMPNTSYHIIAKNAAEGLCLRRVRLDSLISLTIIHRMKWSENVMKETSAMRCRNGIEVGKRDFQRNVERLYLLITQEKKES